MRGKQKLIRRCKRVREAKRWTEDSEKDDPARNPEADSFGLRELQKHARGWKDEIEALLASALGTDGAHGAHGAHHKQWYLHRLAEKLGASAEKLAGFEKGVAP